MTPSTESFAELVPRDLLDRSGEVFYSGRAAFSTPSDVYLLGYNPGSDPSDQRLRTVRSPQASSRSARQFSMSTRHLPRMRRATT